MTDRDGTPAVTLTIDQDKELAVGAAESGVHGFLSVRVSGVDPGSLGAQPAAEVIVIDCSGSMASPSSKIAAAREAGIAAVQALRDGTRFAVVAGTDQARMVYPPDARLETADHDSKAQAADRIRYLYPNGGTAIGAWLRLARRLISEEEPSPSGAQGHRHTLLLTDGWNMHHRELLAAELDACRGMLVCDARGIGDGWNAKELVEIADRLHGTARAVLHDADLRAELEEMVRASMARTLTGVMLRLTPAPGATIRFVKQVYPVEHDLTDGARPAAGSTVEFPTVAWRNDEERVYHVCLDADPAGRPRFEDLQCGYAEVALASAPAAAPGPVPILVHWLPGDAQPTRPSAVSEHFGLHGDFGRVVADAFNAHHAGDRATAQARLGTAVRIAHRLADAEKLAVLAEIVEIADPATGSVTLRGSFDERLLGQLLMISSRTTLVPNAPSTPRPAGAGGEPRRCRRAGCDALSAPHAENCVRCGHPLSTPTAGREPA
ncbi:VWA domain-containing protein [Streptomyces sp. 8K308]|uniref:VWA domain-containing protein n=1 Tax=Streptomyces sp. 8K308 TaxID=2530388 RepID=UPI00104C0952|nr:vWA domain-containing protein [Streptomyces sp. 8K308]TDC25083.1 VWA domain-containing protein [Streptomyces sp. 8K308]